MDSFTLVDGASIAILLISAILAYSRGLTRELLSIAGWIAAAVSAFIFAPSVEPIITLLMQTKSCYAVHHA